MASIVKVQRKKGTAYRVQVRRRGYPTITKTFRLKKNALAFAQEIEGNMEEHAALLKGETRRHTVGELIDRFMDEYEGKDTSVCARMGWWKEHYGERSLADFGKDTVREGLEALRTGFARVGGHKVTDSERKRSPATLNRYRSAISIAFRTGIDCGWFGLEENPVSGIRQKKENNNRFGRSLEDGERTALLDACDASDWTGLGLFVRLALATGARRGELLGIEWRDMDLKNGFVLFRDTKNDDDRRVPLIGEARELLADWAKVRRLDDPRVFPGPAPSKAPPIDRTWQQAKSKAGVENLRIHDLRHSCGTFLAKQGASAFQIAAVLGHRSGPGLTARYVHMVAEDSRDLMEDALGGALK